MTDYKDEVITDLIKDVNQVQGELVTAGRLQEELDQERKTNVQAAIAKMAVLLKDEIKAQTDVTSQLFTERLEQQQDAIKETKHYADQIHAQVE